MDKYTVKKLVKLGVLDRIYCSEDEKETFRQMKTSKLPDDVYSEFLNGSYIYWRYDEAVLSEVNLQTLILLKTATNTKAIKYCAVFFVVLSIISLIFSRFSIFP